MKANWYMYFFSPQTHLEVRPLVSATGRPAHGR
jgi:hypothetical protein